MPSLTFCARKIVKLFYCFRETGTLVNTVLFLGRERLREAHASLLLQVPLGEPLAQQLLLKVPIQASKYLISGSK